MLFKSLFNIIIKKGVIEEMKQIKTRHKLIGHHNAVGCCNHNEHSIICLVHNEHKGRHTGYST